MPGTKQKVTCASDVWQLGVLTMRLLSGNFAYIDSLSDPNPKKKVDSSALIEAINNDIFSYSLRDFLSKCIVSEPDKRATSRQLLEHIWVRDMEA